MPARSIIRVVELPPRPSTTGFLPAIVVSLLMLAVAAPLLDRAETPPAPQAPVQISQASPQIVTAVRPGALRTGGAWTLVADSTRVYVEVEPGIVTPGTLADVRAGSSVEFERRDDLVTSITVRRQDDAGGHA